MWNICRTCMTKQVEMISIFDQGKSPSISAMIMTISSLEFLPNDKLPSEICITCYETLEITYYFKEQVTRCNNALQKQQSQVQRSALLARCKMLAQQQAASNEVAEQSQLDELASNERLEYVPKVDVDDVATENVADSPSKCDPLVIDAYDPFSKCGLLSLKVELPLTSVACDDLPEASSSHHVQDVSSQLEGIDSKTEIIEIEENGVQYGGNCEIIPREILSSYVADDGEFCSDDDLPITSVPESTGRYSTSQNVQQDSNENGEGISEASEGLNIIRYVGNTKKVLKCANCKKLFNRESLLNTHVCKPTHLYNLYKCDFCGKVFRGVHRLKEHLTKHTGERPFKCQYCNATYKHSSTLKLHKRLHTGESTKDHACEVCGKKFRKPYDVKIHMRTHTGERPFPCQYCSAKFAKKDSLMKHTRLHTGERPFKCQYCDATFKTKDNLKYHMRCLHIDETTSKPH